MEGLEGGGEKDLLRGEPGAGGRSRKQPGWTGMLKALGGFKGWEEPGWDQASCLLRPFWQVGGEEARERQAAGPL